MKTAKSTRGHSSPMPSLKCRYCRETFDYGENKSKDVALLERKQHEEKEHNHE